MLQDLVLILLAAMILNLPMARLIWAIPANLPCEGGMARVLRAATRRNCERGRTAGRQGREIAEALGVDVALVENQ